MSVLFHEVDRRQPVPAPQDDERAERLVQSAAEAFACGRPLEGRRLLSQVEPSPDRHDLQLASRILLSTFAGHTSASPQDAAGHEVVATLLLEWGQPLTAFAVLLDGGRGATVAAAARELAASRPADCSLAAVVALHERQFSSALQLLDEAGRQADDAGLHGVLTQISTLVGELSVQLGYHGAAHPSLAAARELSTRTSQPIWAARAASAEATSSVLSESHDRDDLVRRAHRLALAAAPALYDRAELLAATALAADGRWTDAFDVLRRLAGREPADIAELLPAGLLSLLADAATHTGQQAEARTLISRIAAVDTHCECDLELAELLYATAVLSDGAAAETCFEVALSMNPHRLPWHRARTCLARGSWLRRARRVTESRSHLLEAQRIFEALDLPVWVRRAQAELRASGMRTRGEAAWPTGAPDLSPQEREIAQLVARGLTNRQIGEALHLSPRTVGSHLYRIFPKLDVTSRNQLAALLP